MTEVDRRALIGPMKNKLTLLAEVMTDLQLGMEGFTGGRSGERDGELLGRKFPALARICSVFLRKTVLGHRDDPDTRLLSDDVLASTGLKFDRLRGIPRNKRTWIDVDSPTIPAAAGTVHVKLKSKPELLKVASFEGGPQQVRLRVEWPLMGMADWTDTPSAEVPWVLGPDQLFEVGGSSPLDCNSWLAQQLILFDGRGVSLKKMIQHMVNSEGAHSFDMFQSAGGPFGRRRRGVGSDPAPYVLSCLLVCGLPYPYLVVVTCALYLYEKLLEIDVLQQPAGTPIGLGVHFVGPPTSDTTVANCLGFEGVYTLVFDGKPSLTQHSIKAPRAR